MARKSALQKIESHEKLCRIMQKQTFEQIKEMQDRIKRLEYWIVGGMGAVLIVLLTDIAWIFHVTSPSQSLSKATPPYVGASTIILTQNK